MVKIVEYSCSNQDGEPDDYRELLWRIKVMPAGPK